MIKLQNILIIVLFFPIAVIQLTIVPFVHIQDVTPNLLTILIVYITLNRGQVYGTFTGFLYGLFFDLISGGVLGSSMFAQTLTGFLAGYFYDENNSLEYRSLSFILSIVLLCSFVSSFFYSLLCSTEINSFAQLFIANGILSAIYTTLVAIPFSINKNWRVF